MTRDDYVKLVTQTAATLLAAHPEFHVSEVINSKSLAENAVEAASTIVDEAVQAAILVEENGGLYQDDDRLLYKHRRNRKQNLK